MILGTLISSCTAPLWWERLGEKEEEEEEQEKEKEKE